VKQISIQAIESLFEQDNELNKGIDFFYTAFGDSSINYEIRFWIAVSGKKEMTVAKSEGVMAIKAAYNTHNISIPFLIRTFDFGKDKFRSETITL
jgi:small conductance mechanosensitive channel